MLSQALAQIEKMRDQAAIDNDAAGSSSSSSGILVSLQLSLLEHSVMCHLITGSKASYLGPAYFIHIVYIILHYHQASK